MAVPNTNVFSLQDVENEIPGAQGNLVNCFSSASANGFDPTYEGTKNSLLNFRNYLNATFKLSTYNLYFGLSGGSSLISITSTSSWIVSSTSPGVSVNISSGNAGTTNVTVTVGSTGSSRNGSVVFTSNGINRSVVIAQT
jgi:hypothetical protein